MKIFCKFTIMNKFISCLLLLTSSLLVFTACDYIANPLLPQSHIVTNNNQDTLLQNILIEDYTGCGCEHCPSMATRAEELIAQYGNRVIFMEVNYGGYANPSSSGPPYNAWDAETTVGDAYGNLFVGNSASFPFAMVNRLHFPQTLQQLSDSSIMADTALNILTTNVGGAITTNTAVPGIYIRLSTSFNVATSALNVTATITFLKAYTGNYNLTVLLTQDSIWGPQNDLPTPFPSGFWHRFALRDNLTASPWGDAIITGNAAANQVVTKTYSYTLKPSYQSPDSNKPPILSNYKQSYVVAFVSDGLSASPTYYQVMQVQQKKIYP
jgi:thiol-disulfide isomerase/thioredoxin